VRVIDVVEKGSQGDSRVAGKVSLTGGPAKVR
jgi:hypothetical protein